MACRRAALGQSRSPDVRRESPRNPCTLASSGHVATIVSEARRYSGLSFDSRHQSASRTNPNSVWRFGKDRFHLGNGGSVVFADRVDPCGTTAKLVRRASVPALRIACGDRLVVSSRAGQELGAKVVCLQRHGLSSIARSRAESAVPGPVDRSGCAQHQPRALLRRGHGSDRVPSGWQGQGFSTRGPSGAALPCPVVAGIHFDGPTNVGDGAIAMAERQSTSASIPCA